MVSVSGATHASIQSFPSAVFLKLVMTSILPENLGLLLLSMLAMVRSLLLLALTVRAQSTKPLFCRLSVLKSDSMMLLFPLMRIWLFLSSSLPMCRRGMPADTVMESYPLISPLMLALSGMYMSLSRMFRSRVVSRMSKSNSIVSALYGVCLYAIRLGSWRCRVFCMVVASVLNLKRPLADRLMSSDFMLRVLSLCLSYSVVTARFMGPTMAVSRFELSRRMSLMCNEPFRSSIVVP